jgi:uncharacterized damage-inducible protein DinB
MPMTYSHTAIPAPAVPKAREVWTQHVVDTYASEINKTATVWLGFERVDWDYRPDGKSSTVGEILRHQLLSERRFFGEFLGSPEPPPGEVLPERFDPEAYAVRLAELAAGRLAFLAAQPGSWWIETVPFFDTHRERIWIFWRRMLHTSHHRTQLTMYQRTLGRDVPPTYGPTADVTWDGADPTHTIEAAGRKS